jgi:hypothetical protein
MPKPPSYPSWWIQPGVFLVQLYEDGDVLCIAGRIAGHGRSGDRRVVQHRSFVSPTDSSLDLL